MMDTTERERLQRNINERAAAWINDDELPQADEPTSAGIFADVNASSDPLEELICAAQCAHTWIEKFDTSDFHTEEAWQNWRMTADCLGAALAKLEQAK